VPDRAIESRLSEEINVVYGEGCFFATAMLTRGVLDHVPPVFGPLESPARLVKKAHDNLWKEAIQFGNTQELISDLFEVVKTISKDRHKSFDLETAIMIMGAIYLLERAGRIKPDESSPSPLPHVPGQLLQYRLALENRDDAAGCQ
jgi:hypothetical protein